MGVDKGFCFILPDGFLPVRLLFKKVSQHFLAAQKLTRHLEVVLSFRTREQLA